MAADTAPRPAASKSAPMTAGLYNDGSVFQRGMNEAAREELLTAATAAARLPPPHPTSPLAFADFGCSEGANAVAQMSAAVEVAKKELGPATTRPITITHVDLTDNPWGTVFGCVADTPGYNEPPRSFVFALGTPAGFYAQAFPTGSISLSHGAATFHWGSTAPASLPDYCLFPWLSSDAAIRAACADQAAKDWATILRLRAVELCAGGRFVAALVAAPPTLALDGAVDMSSSLPSMWKHVASTWSSLVEDGILTPEEAAGVVIPVNMSTPSQLTLPLADEAEGALGSLFRVVKAEAIDMMFPQWEAYQRTHDAAQYAADLRLFLEAVLKGMQVGAVAKHRSGAAADGAATAAAAVDTFYARLEAALKEDPQPASQTVVIMHLERK